ncbi:copper chaperone PCu(A)C [Roseomonas frigidaquae]|uniref:Copper chaperone PCu(A)C n=1 Tax=Falsiroseomonas frigidaquae TaxID=487318 RepID=A0ABX1F816_9PROT|nr:copper chaperone PCu(A)C [Falsiroseomonas frigidaquae]NKE48536.1 copper chaperone PCu(A)C [Falsiroseomonas frigidaquae]
MKDQREPRRRWLALAIAIAWQAVSSRPAAAQDGQGGSVVVSGGWAQAVPPEARESRGFLVVRNTGSMTARLVSAWSPDVEAVRMLERDPVSATAFRSPPEGFSIPPDGTLTMEPGGPHLALDGLRQPLGPGDAIRVFLRFERAGEIAVELRGHDH